MPRNVSSPLLESSASSRRTRRRSFIVLAILGIIVLVGLLLIGGRPRLPKPTPFGQGTGGAGKETSSKSNMADYHVFLVKDDFKSKKLSTEQLQSLIGMYYAKAPKASELKSLFEAGTKIITREQLPENSRIYRLGSIVTMDWDEDRLNVQLDSKDYIAKVKYG